MFKNRIIEVISFFTKKNFIKVLINTIFSPINTPKKQKGHL